MKQLLLRFQDFIAGVIHMMLVMTVLMLLAVWMVAATVAYPFLIVFSRQPRPSYFETVHLITRKPFSEARHPAREVIVQDYAPKA